MRIKNFGLNLKLVERKTRLDMPAQVNWKRLRKQAKKDFRELRYENRR